MKYTVKREDYEPNDATPFYVALNDLPDIGYNFGAECGELPESKAQAIAFTLNALANGEQLFVRRRVGTVTHAMIRYDGPTEGI